MWRIVLLTMCGRFPLRPTLETTHSLSVVKDTAWSRWAWTWGPVSCRLGLAVGSVLWRSRSPTKSLCCGRNSFLKSMRLQSASEGLPLKGAPPQRSSPASTPREPNSWILPLVLSVNNQHLMFWEPAGGSSLLWQIYLILPGLLRKICLGTQKAKLGDTRLPWRIHSPFR